MRFIYIACHCSLGAELWRGVEGWGQLQHGHQAKLYSYLLSNCFPLISLICHLKKKATRAATQTLLSISIQTPHCTVHVCVSMSYSYNHTMYIHISSINLLTPWDERCHGYRILVKPIKINAFLCLCKIKSETYLGLQLKRIYVIGYPADWLFCLKRCQKRVKTAPKRP